MCACTEHILHRHNSIYIDVEWIIYVRLRKFSTTKEHTVSQLYPCLFYRTDERFFDFCTYSYQLLSYYKYKKIFSPWEFLCTYFVASPDIHKKSKMNEHLKFLRATNEFPISIFNSLIHRTDYLMNWNSSLLNCIPSDKIWYLIIACESKIQPFFKDREKGSERSINYYYYFARRTSQLERRAIEKKKIGGIFKDITLNLNFSLKKKMEKKKKSQEDLLYARKVGSSWKE